MQKVKERNSIKQETIRLI